MKTSIFLVFTACALVVFSFPAFALDVSGTWDMQSTSRFTVSMQQSGELVKGSYAFGKGHSGQIVGLMFDDGVLEGFWFQSTANKKCRTAKNGTYYWGRLMLKFTGDSVQGKDNYCDAAPQNPWTGKKKP